MPEARVPQHQQLPGFRTHSRYDSGDLERGCHDRSDCQRPAQSSLRLKRRPTPGKYQKFAPETFQPTFADISPSAPLSQIEVGQRLDDFDLLIELGSGAFARVFLARQLSLQRLVAVKISANHGHEPQTLAQLDHDYIVRVFDQRILRDGTGGCCTCSTCPAGRCSTSSRRICRTERPPDSGQALLDAVDERTGVTRRDPAHRIDHPRRARDPFLARDCRVAGETTGRSVALCDVAGRPAPRHQARERAARTRRHPQTRGLQHQLRPQRLRRKPVRLFRRLTVLHVARAAQGLPARAHARRPQTSTPAATSTRSPSCCGNC